VDVGGESTRPGAAGVPAEEEMGRVIPAIGALAASGVVVSADTSKASVARAAVAAGAA
ncbi:MAG: dihydropteroate synthase, partial [Actinobacteria bacterium]|nr:dihydropteroate synthase [Actinomycetota bacterium]NIV54080.1 dihydropteroate synthase [Actinomycetota bacterium]NIX48937.1 dihydropteroate synthase [Actinomycetota bacterium]